MLFLFEKEKKKFNRIKYIMGIFAVLLLCLSVRLYFLQVHPSEMVVGRMQNHQTENIAQMKYNILDTNGENMLAYNKEYVMVLDTEPFKLNNYEETLQDLMALNFIMKSEDKDFNYTGIMNEVGKHYYKISKETFEKVNKLSNVKGIYTYVYDKIERKEAWEIGNLLSEIGENGDVVEGSLEAELNKYLGENLIPQSKFYLDDKAVYSDGSLDTNNENKNLKLTINNEWQNKVKEVLKRKDYDFLKNVGVVISEAETGKIRVMAQKDDSQANVNIGVEALGFEPGSIFKVVTEAVALDLGLIHTQDVFGCTGQICSKDGKPYGHGNLSVEAAIKISCNDVTAKVGGLAGYEKIMEYSEKMGLFNRVLNIQGENRNEAAGIKPPKEAGINNISIGQTIMVTPLQMAGVYNTIANDGVYVKQTLVEEILNKDGKPVKKFKNEPVRVFSQTTAKITQETLGKVIWEGSGFEAKVKGVEIGGKTGTSTGKDRADHGWFAGYFVKDEKKYSIVVIAPNIGTNHPDGRELGGGNTGAPIFRDIVTELTSK
ncbi:penicillin-binding transpeptidase domain-containing protein [Clostridium gasigenes]|uniref:penicillin-binding transpeptidase domain-containing protein n=1 Tax=Clostridium gasigenes TaxID=94869 RepID=UPI0033995540